jgi:CRP-like cAMP-binding protein
MPRTTHLPPRLLADGTPLRNRLLLALPPVHYERIAADLRVKRVVVGQALHERGKPIAHVYFPNGGVFSVTTEMDDGELVEVATVGREGMLGIGVFFGDRTGAGKTFQQVPDGVCVSMSAARFVEASAIAGPFRQVISLYAQANLLQIMQCTACNALHDVTQRCCRWLLQTQDRVEADDFTLKQEFLAIMLGVNRPTVTLVIGKLRDAGLVATHYGRMQVLNRKRLETMSCECYRVIQREFHRLGL